MDGTQVGVALQGGALVASGVALVLAVLTWEQFRGSPFGRVVLLLPLLLAFDAAAAVASLTLPRASTWPRVLEAVTFTWLLVLAVALVWLHGTHSSGVAR